MWDTLLNTTLYLLAHEIILLYLVGVDSQTKKKHK